MLKRVYNVTAEAYAYTGRHVNMYALRVVGQVYRVMGWSLFKVLYYYALIKNMKFTFNGEEVKYFYHTYNNTHTNERCIEIALFKRFLEEYRKKSDEVLEIGNVLSHYIPVEHMIIDKFEKDEANKVLNLDIEDVDKLKKKFDLILSISTLEHVGFDEGENDTVKITKVIDKLKSCLKPNGKIIFSVPVGYNKHLDEALGIHDSDGTIKLDSVYYFKRVGAMDWEQTFNKHEARTLYGSPLMAANSLIIGVIDR